jgi:hypothetical protein
MKSTREVTRLLQQEFPDILPNAIWENEDGSYSVFGKYQIVPEKPSYRVFCAATDVGLFSTTRTALSWCIADKNQAFNLAREIHEVDTKIVVLTSDIAVRTNVAERSKNFDFREVVGTKLESKIIKKKQLENQLTKCVNWAKYCQQRGFNNETARTGRGQPNKASR